MERLPFTQLFQQNPSANPTAAIATICSPPIHSPTAAETYSSYHAVPHPAEDISYAVTSHSAALRNACVSSSYHSDQLVDPTSVLYHSSSVQASMMPISGHPMATSLPLTTSLPITETAKSSPLEIMSKPQSPVLSAETTAQHNKLGISYNIIIIDTIFNCTFLQLFRLN